jgi:sugar (pentulose or hexulose) kinase
MGVALLAGLGAGIYDSPEEATKQTYKIHKTIMPDDGWQALYEDPYRRYRRYVTALHTLED